MKNSTICILIIFLLVNCSSNYPTSNINNSGKTVRERVSPPNEYQWVNEESNSIGEFLQNIVLESDGSNILDYTGNPIDNQSEHVAVLKYDVGTKDLQQCADAIVRIRAEYLYSLKRYDEIGFHFTSGDMFTWNNYKNGYRPIISSNGKVNFKIIADKDESYINFRKYLNIIYTYSGTISVFNETKKVENDNNIQAGDILITPGSPGHAIIIIGRAKNKNGNIVYLLAEGYTPAQSIHIITNPYNDKINPWYEISTSDRTIVTARYTFLKPSIRTYK
jgi:hypothetical protein